MTAKNSNWRDIHKGDTYFHCRLLVAIIVLSVYDKLSSSVTTVLAQRNAIMEAVYYHLGTVKVAARVIYESFRDMPPIHTWHMWPAHLQERVDSHQFPPMADLVVPALGYFMLLNVARYALQYFIFRVISFALLKRINPNPRST